MEFINQKILEQLNFIAFKNIRFSVLLMAIFLTTNFAKAQSIDTTTVEQYSSVNVYPIAFSNKVKIELDYGDFMSLYKDNRLKDEFGKVKKFNTVIDALNFMGANGWSLISGMPITGSTTYYAYVFKRRFKKSELENKD